MYSTSMRIAVVALGMVFTNSATFGEAITGTAGGRFDDGQLKNEIIASNFFLDGFQIGLLEFDLGTLTPAPNASIVLELYDSGGLTSGLSSTRIFAYSGDGLINADDLTATAVGSFDITRPYLSNEFTTRTTEHDVTSLVNTILVSGGTHVGFRFEPITGGDGGQDAFGFFNQNQLVFSDTPAPSPVPEPASIVLLASGAVCLGGCRWRRKRRQRPA